MTKFVMPVIDRHNQNSCLTNHTTSESKFVFLQVILFSKIKTQKAPLPGRSFFRPSRPGIGCSRVNISETLVSIAGKVIGDTLPEVNQLKLKF